LLNAIPSQYHLFFGIGGLVFLLLFITGVAQRFQAYQFEKEVALRRILSGIQHLEHGLSLLEGCAVPQKLLVLLRKEILARYLAIRQIHKRLNNLNTMISQAQRNLSSAESKGEGHVNRPSDQGQLNNYLAGLTELMNFLNSEGRVTGMNDSERSQFAHQLDVLRAEYVSVFFNAEAKRLAENQQWSEAIRQLKECLHFLQGFGSSDQRSRELYRQANLHYKQVQNRQLPGESSNNQPDNPQAVHEMSGAV